MNKNEIFEKISNARNSRVSEKENERLCKIKHVNEMYQKALGYREKVVELCEIINFARQKGYIIEPYSHFMGRYTGTNPELCTDGITHMLGFFQDFSSIGNKAGGCDGLYDFVVDADDVFIKEGNTRISFNNYDPDATYRFTDSRIWFFPERCLESFVNGGFERFEKEVYAFIDNIDKFTCHI